MARARENEMPFIVIFRMPLTVTEAAEAVGKRRDLRVTMPHRTVEILAAMPERDFAAFAGMQTLPDPPESESDAMVRHAEERRANE